MAKDKKNNTRDHKVYPSFILKTSYIHTTKNTFQQLEYQIRTTQLRKNKIHKKYIFDPIKRAYKHIATMDDIMGNAIANQSKFSYVCEKQFFQFNLALTYLIIVSLHQYEP